MIFRKTEANFQAERLCSVDSPEVAQQIRVWKQRIWAAISTIPSADGTEIDHVICPSGKSGVRRKRSISFFTAWVDVIGWIALFAAREELPDQDIVHLERHTGQPCARSSKSQENVIAALTDGETLPGQRRQFSSYGK